MIKYENEHVYAITYVITKYRNRYYKTHRLL